MNTGGEIADSEIIRAYYEVYKSTRVEEFNEEFYWASYFLDDLIEKDTDRLILILKKISESEYENEFICFVAAGPLEQLLSNKGEEVIDKVEKLA